MKQTGRGKQERVEHLRRSRKAGEPFESSDDELKN